ncbi:MAG: DUF4837 family protein [Bacteroidia bacterium]|nr:DUF4837 family protein [Bacteroidia bacterium]NND52007.1 DUF4837 family protein [Flavobacteriaceae bacterium]
MKKVAVLALALMVLLACDNTGDKRLLSSSSGNINSLSVVIDNELWEGSVGESVRKVLAAPVYGLPQEEPLFSLRQMPPQVFTDFATKNRTVLKIESGKAADTKFLKDVFAKPQKLILVTGMSSKEIIDQIETNAEAIVSAFKTEELKEKQRRIRISLHKNNSIEEKMGLSIRFPSVYRIAKEEDNFYWIRKDIRTGSMNLMVYEMPLDAISKDENAITDIIKMRDSIGKAHIPGPVEGSYMITEAAYTPYLNQTIIDNKPTLETKSTWEVKNAFMAGPFINYIIEDKTNNRLVVAEGFTFAPSIEKRNQIFELEAIIRSIKIK